MYIELVYIFVYIYQLYIHYCIYVKTRLTEPGDTRLMYVHMYAFSILSYQEHPLVRKANSILMAASGVCYRIAHLHNNTYITYALHFCIPGRLYSLTFFVYSLCLNYWIL